MGWKGCFFSEATRCSLRQGQLHIEQAGQEYHIPLEDLAFIVLDSPQVRLTSALLAACAEVGCLVLTTDARHIPNGVLHSFHAYHRQEETIELQLALTEPRRKRLWQGLVQHKIRNQADCLHRLGFARAARTVQVLAQKVRSGDPDNVEGQAARAYWSGLEPRFLRDSEGEDRLNVLLNYGYALIRSALAQTLAAYGFLPSLGVHHCNRQNAFNLADDMIEPWRPLADACIIRYWQEGDPQEQFSPADRKYLLGIFSLQVQWVDGEQQLLPALRRYVEQLRPCYAGSQKELFCPSFPASSPS